MITKEKFEDLIGEYFTYDMLINQAEGIFPMIYESKLVHFAWKWYEELINSYFDKNGQDWIGAYLYEGCRKYWKDNVEHKIDNIDDLWELVKEYRV